MTLHQHNHFVLGKVEKTSRDIEGKTQKLMRRDIYAAGQKVGSLEIPTGQLAAPGYLRTPDDSLIIRWERPKKTAVEFFFYSEANEPRGSLKMTSGLFSKDRKLEFRDAANTLFIQFEGTSGKMSKEKNAGIFKDIQGTTIGRTYRGYKDPASGMKGPLVEANGYQEYILASILPLCDLCGYNPNKY